MKKLKWWKMLSQDHTKLSRVWEKETDIQDWLELTMAKASPGFSGGNCQEGAEKVRKVENEVTNVIFAKEQRVMEVQTK